MRLPPSFKLKITTTFGEPGRDFLRALPGLVEWAARTWDLTDIQAVPKLSFNYVATALQNGQHVILKLGVSHPEVASEIAALQIFDGRGSARFLQADEGRNALLIERLVPGDMLVSVPDDRQATLIAAAVMLRLRRTNISDPRLAQVASWFQGFARHRLRFGGRTGPLDEHLFELAEGFARDLLSEPHVPTLLHGDLHHFNILASQRGWLAIDPKGVIGPAGFEVGPFLLNPWVEGEYPPNAAAILADRIAILSEALGMTSEWIRQWGLAYAVLSAVWSLEDGANGEPALAGARVLAGL